MWKKKQIRFFHWYFIQHNLIILTCFDSKHRTTFNKRRNVFLRKIFHDSIMTNRKRNSKNYIEFHNFMLSKLFHDVLFKRISKFTFLNNFSNDSTRRKNQQFLFKNRTSFVFWNITKSKRLRSSKNFWNANQNSIDFNVRRQFKFKWKSIHNISTND